MGNHPYNQNNQNNQNNSTHQTNQNHQSGKRKSGMAGVQAPRFNSLYEDRPLPHSNEAEIAVLGTSIYDPATVYKVTEALSEDHFYRPSHQYVFRAMKELIKKKLQVDFVTLEIELRGLGLIEKVGGLPALTALLDGKASSRVVESYMEIIQEKHARRQQIKIAAGMLADAYSDDFSSMEITERVQSQLRELRSLSQIKLHHVAPIIGEQLEAIAKGRVREIVDYIPTGFRDMDAAVGGMARGNLIIIAARPSVGKTSLATTMAINMATAGYSVAFFTMEMSAKEFAARVICGTSWVNLQEYQRGFLSERQMERLAHGYEAIKQQSFFLNDQRLTPNQILGLCQTHRAKHGLDAVFVDYLQIVKSSAPNANREQQVARIAQELKEMARMLNVPVIALAQLNRQCDAYQQPKLDDLRESGAIEQDADKVMFLWREQGYDSSADRGEVGFSIEKNRNGPTQPAVTLQFLKPCTRFVETHELFPPEMADLINPFIPDDDSIVVDGAPAATDDDDTDNDMPF